MNKLSSIVVTVVLVACGGKQGAPASGGGGGAAAGGGDGAAVCAEFSEKLKGLGTITQGDPANHEGREGDWSCRASVQAANGFTCHLAMYATPELAAASNDRLANSFWVVPQSDGKTSYNKAGTKAVVWCGGGAASEAAEVEPAARAVADAS